MGLQEILKIPIAHSTNFSNVKFVQCVIVPLTFFVKLGFMKCELLNSFYYNNNLLFNTISVWGKNRFGQKNKNCWMNQLFIINFELFFIVTLIYIIRCTITIYNCRNVTGIRVKHYRDVIQTPKMIFVLLIPGAYVHTELVCTLGVITVIVFQGTNVRQSSVTYVFGT